MSETLWREIRNVAVITAILGIVQVIITIPVGYFGYPAVLGTLVGCILAVLNFSLMGFVLEKCMSAKGGAGGFAGVGYILRLAIIAAIVIWAMKVHYLNYVCVIIPLIFPQASIFIINFIRRKERKADKDERA
ncbi:MAG: ATP synthase subunit I [Hominilimicola sp.]